MTRVLILGGTAWLGNEIARSWVRTGAEVVCVARGESGAVPPGAELVRADRRHPSAYDAARGEWDEVVELSYDPAFVESALNVLADRARHWTLVSSVSVYARDDEPGADETAELVEPVDLSRYADAKVAAERVSSSRIGERLLVVRPGLIVGPGDPTDRFGYWVARLLRGGRILAPTTAGRYVQVIDVADLAAWACGAGRRRVTGTYNAVGVPHPMTDFFRLARETTDFRGEFVHLADDTLLAHDVRYWAGPRSLPLWLPPEASAFAQRDATAFRSAGGSIRPLRDTLIRARDDEIARGLNRTRRSGLTRAEEASVAESLRPRLADT